MNIFVYVDIACGDLSLTGRSNNHIDIYDTTEFIICACKNSFKGRALGDTKGDRVNYAINFAVEAKGNCSKTTFFFRTS